MSSTGSAWEAGEEAEHDEHEHRRGGDEGGDGGDAGDAADRRPGEGRQQQAAQRLAPEQRVALAGERVDRGLQFGDRGLVLAGVVGRVRGPPAASRCGPPRSA